MLSKPPNQPDYNNKSSLRLLKLLNKVGKSDYAVEASFILVQRHKFPKSLAENLYANDLISFDRVEIAINDHGRALLKRMLHPDNPFTAQNADLKSVSVPFEDGFQQAQVNLKESPLARLFLRKDKSGETWLNEKQFLAGERLRADFERAQLQPRISANWEASVASSNRAGVAADLSDFAIDARKRLENAVLEIGPELSDVVLDVCCYLKGLELIESEKGWPPRSAKLMLRTALAALSRHYGLEQVNQKNSNRSWGDKSFRSSVLTQEAS